MIVQIDNSGLHSAGDLFISPKHCDYSNIDNLTHLCTLIALSNNIYINNFELDEVVDKSKYIISIFKNLGCSNIFKFRNTKEDEFIQILNLAKNNLIATLDLSSFNFSNIKSNDLAPTMLSSRHIKARYSYMDILNTTNSSYLSELKEKATKDKMEGAINYLFSAYEDLRVSIKKLNGIHNWDERKKFLFNAFLRIEINNAYADLKNSSYAPSISRSQLIHNNNKIVVIDKLDEILDEKIEQKIKRDFEVPPLELFLLKKANGSPKAMVQEALLIREQFMEFRRNLSKMNTLYHSNNLTKELKNISKQLTANLKIEEEPNSFISFYKDPWYNLSKLFNPRQGTITVLTNIVQSVNSPIDNRVDLKNMFFT